MADLLTGSIPNAGFERRQAAADCVPVHPANSLGAAGAGRGRETVGDPERRCAQPGPVPGQPGLSAPGAPRACDEREEELIPDARSGLSPAQLVEKKLMALLHDYHAVSVEMNLGPAELRNRVRGPRPTPRLRGPGATRRSE
jgi:hypothetical protein